MVVQPHSWLNMVIRVVYHDHPVAITAKRSLRLAVQDAALSRLKHEFDSRRERQLKDLFIRKIIQMQALILSGFLYLGNDLVVKSPVDINALPAGTSRLIDGLCTLAVHCPLASLTNPMVPLSRFWGYGV
jgi:hypothetical protein